MPRCFLAKKSNNTPSNAALQWPQPTPALQQPTAAATIEEDTNNNKGREDADPVHRSTVGSISAAKAVLSIQEPICPPPAHQASIMASSSVAKAAAMAMAMKKEPNNNNRSTQTLPWISSEPRTVKAGARPPRRKKPIQRLPLNLTMGDQSSKVPEDCGAGLTILRQPPCPASSLPAGSNGKSLDPDSFTCSINKFWKAY